MTTHKLPLQLRRKKNTHKKDYGHVLILAGSKGLAGAPVLAAEAALRSGAGLVTLGVPESIYPIVARKVMPDIMVQPLPDDGKGAFSSKAFTAAKPLIEKADVMAVGPGLSRRAGPSALVRALIQKATQPLVVDADAITALSTWKKLPYIGAERSVVFTPHPGEMATLLGTTTAVVQKDRKQVAKEVAQSLGVTMLLKGHRTVVASSVGKTVVNTTGNPGMAVAGMGDVLTGMIAAFIGQGMTGFEAARWGAYFHGLAGDKAAKQVGQVSLTASDLLEALRFGS